MEALSLDLSRRMLVVASLLWNFRCAIFVVKSVLDLCCGIFAEEYLFGNLLCGLLIVDSLIWNINCGNSVVESWLWNLSC